MVDAGVVLLSNGYAIYSAANHKDALRTWSLLARLHTNQGSDAENARPERLSDRFHSPLITRSTLPARNAFVRRAPNTIVLVWSTFVVVKTFVGDFTTRPAPCRHLSLLHLFAALERNVVFPLRIRRVSIHGAPEQPRPELFY